MREVKGKKFEGGLASEPTSISGTRTGFTLKYMDRYVNRKY